MGDIGSKVIDNLHQKVVDYAVKRLKKQGVSDILFEANVGPKGRKFRIDILGVHDGERIGVECYIQTQPKRLKLRIPLLKVDKLIFCVPDEREAEKIRYLGHEIWIAGLEVPKKTAITISVPTRKRIYDLQEYGESVEDIMVRLLDYYKEGQKQ